MTSSSRYCARTGLLPRGALFPRGALPPFDPPNPCTSSRRRFGLGPIQLRSWINASNQERLAMPLAHFTAFLAGIGYHESAWRLADAAYPSGPALAGADH